MLGLKPPPKHARVHSEEELGMIIEESEKAGMMTKEERMMLERVFAFHDT
jgi:CBS domain containing-hemolysin-like protein